MVYYAQNSLLSVKRMMPLHFFFPTFAVGPFDDDPPESSPLLLDLPAQCAQELSPLLASGELAQGEQPGKESLEEEQGGNMPDPCR